MRDFQILRDRRPGPWDFCDTRRRGGQHLGYIAEARQQRFGEWFGVLAGNGAEEQQLQQLVVSKRAIARFFEPLPQSRAMIVIVWFDLDRRHLAGSLFVLPPRRQRST